MACGIFLALIASCLLDLGVMDVPYPGIIPEEAVGYNIDSNRGVSNTQNKAAGVYCWECTIEKSMDNRVVSLWDEINKKAPQGNQCEAHKCANGQDWCLVTYYRIKAINGAMEGKRERHECGSRNDRDRDAQCQTLLAEDKDHNSIVPRTCKTERSGGYSVHSFYSVSLSALLSLVALVLLH